MLLNRATGKPLTPANREGVPSSHDARRKDPGLGFRRTLTPAGKRDARAPLALGSKARADAKSGPFALALGVCWLAACASPIAPVEAPSSRSLASAPASSRLHVRSTPDEDPSRFLGAFVKRGVRPDDISEGDAVRTRCSSSFRVVRVPATQEFDESFEVRKEAGASVGLTAGLGLEGSAQSTGTLRIHYRTTEKLVVEVDADALGRCCRAAPSECTDTVVGEFVRASGQVFTGTTSEQTAKAGFTHPVGTVGANAGSKNDWKAVSRFENTYFAFATRSVALPTVSAGAADPTDCSFCAQLPTSLDGKYFCGLSEPSPSESGARAAAMANAREQVLHSLSETLSLRTTLGPVNKLVVAERASNGLVSGVKDERWCPSKATATSEGPRYEAKVLAFVPKALLGKAASDAVLGVVEERRRAGTLTPDQERELRAMATRLSHGEEP
jgi:hypothetical protein